MPRTDVASKIVNAPPDRVFDAFVDPEALLRWLPPSGMTAGSSGSTRDLEGRTGWCSTYADASRAPGKSTADSDVVEARFVDIVSGRRVVQAVDFVSDDPSFSGTMTMTWTVSEAAEGGTRVEFRADDVPDGVTAEDHAAGLTSSLANLAAYVER